VNAAVVGLAFACLIAVSQAPASQAAGPSVGLVAFDSGTRVVREVAEALSGTGRSILECYPRGSEIFLGLISLFPERMRIGAVEWGMRLSLGYDADRATDVSVDALAEWCIDQYPDDGSRYPAIVIGSPNGAVAHLAALLGAPFLTTSFGLAFRHDTVDPDDLAAYRRTSLGTARRILAANAEHEVEIVCHYDPIHDRSIVQVADFLRIKLHDLPVCYRTFVSDRLAPDGSLILVECAYLWPQIALDERIFLQIGGLGAIEPEAYLERWAVDGRTSARRESEWGCPEPFADAVDTYAEAHGVDVLEIRFDHPAEYSLLAYDAYLACDGVRRQRLLIDTFNHQNPRTNIQTGIPGLWLPFNTEDGLALAERALWDTALDTVYLAPLPSFSRSPDTAALDAWMKLLAAHGTVAFVGVRSDKYPADPLAPYRFSRDLRSLRTALTLDEPLHLHAQALERLVAAWTLEKP
jgi:hypothetical protein